MTYYIAILLTLGTVVGVILAVQLGLLLKAVEDNTAETRELRLKARARIRRASMQSGATSDEQMLQRLGRASAARRIVVGGDDDSQLNQSMQATTDGGTDG